MPELPDITVYVEALEPRILHQRLERVRIASPFLLRTADPPLTAVQGKSVQALERIGKLIAIGLEGDLWLVLHLIIAGRLHWREPGVKLAAKRGLAGLRKKSDAAREAHGATVAELAPRRAEWECVEEGAARAAEAFEARKLLQLAAMVEQPEPQLCSWARVNELLDRNARSRPAGAPELVRSVSA